MIDDTKRETIVFAYDTEDQRRELLLMFPEWFNKSHGLRIVALSHDNEMRRVTLIEEAIERYSDHYDRRDAIDAVLQHPNLSRFTWSEYETEDAPSDGELAPATCPDAPGSCECDPGTGCRKPKPKPAAAAAT